ncbi:Benzoyl-CoA reductase/2-hydroxyglutaryl-CoA dehydratase subunit, BcrC/BadD/HgdB [Desulfosporosinus acidiphilus SJ4]|uniref:Benzoyl-CoA reductase/2-hydroxyglutaryl-CoA dehydratase subunit, BcrC/BadD/HgdB n=1 Tax=Desulfosporosinus acidiphilus (strain DSM 22704 / JCM 16185 / SJ4) TaxID=646529 RepID=I4D634_DESAJ|nr:2-hydroxyacyl-CoA dehydratase family protein [Desulfosporosinus acidiphilus]AFM41258.1 Benzoyl-CoA reductase/2-hydroxyglutaryl-CoA dehydratase subunit, BcrC/BadD/HgdB [Desulfosporosinus acidiphilus SJ4]
MSNGATEALKYLKEEAYLNGTARLQRYPEHKFFGYFCSYFPEELILAAELEPIRLFPDNYQSTPAELPGYCCSLARGTLEMEIERKWHDLSGVGFTHTCDTMQCLSGVWACSGHTPSLNLVPPVMLTALGAAQYYFSELETLVKQFALLTDKEITHSQLRTAIDLCNQVRELASQLDSLRPQLPSQLISALLRAGQVMPRSIFCEVLGACLPEIRKMAAPEEHKLGVLLTGAILENDHLFAMIEDLGGRVVADDTCSGYRHYAGQRFASSDNPLRDIVQRYSTMPPCPCKNKNLNERLDYIERLALERKAKAAIIVIRKYCEPHAWDSVSLLKCLQNRGLRTLCLELEGANVGGQERTRLQAFLESMM